MAGNLGRLQVDAKCSIYDPLFTEGSIDFDVKATFAYL